ncbi:MAG: hypothetical protein Fues2KO_10840 [Fuerstiella sp.]
MLTAFRYVAGELKRSESDRFEQQMETDVTLCDAVIQATEISLAVAPVAPVEFVQPAANGLAETTTVRSDVSVQHVRPKAIAPAVGRSSRLTAVCLSMACCLLVVVGVMLIQTPNPSEMLAGSSGSSGTLLDDAQQQASDQAELILTAWADSFAADAVEEFSETTNSELAVPEWMFAAVDLGEGESSDPALEPLRPGEMEL